MKNIILDLISFIVTMTIMTLIAIPITAVVLAKIAHFIKL